MWNFPLFPDQASTMARQVDALYFFELGIAGFFTALICVLILTFAARYRQKAIVDRSNPPTASKLMEVLWIGVPLVLGMVMFVWGANLYFRIYDPPGDALEVAVVAKQWMWYLQHAEGRSEINELHVPLGRPVQADDDLAGRDSQLLCSGVSSEARRAAGPLHVALVRADPGGPLSPVLRRVLRDESFDDGGMGYRHGAG